MQDEFRTLVEAMPDAILVQSRDRIVFVNPACMRLLGAERSEQLVGKDVSEIIHPNSLPTIRRRIQECYENRTPVPPLENILVSLNGASIPTECTAIFITWKGSPAIEVVLRDIRDRKRAEERLRQYERLVEGLEEMIAVIDRDYRYVVANRAFLNYRGMESEYVVGRLVSEVLDQAFFETVAKEKLDECFTGKVVKYELTYAYPKLGVRDLSVTYLPVEVPGGVTGAVCVLQDITERKRLERDNEEWHQRLKMAEQAGLRIGLWDWDMAADTVIWSDETCRQFGYARGTFSGRVEDAVGRIHPEDRPRVEAAIQTAVEGAAQYAMQYRVVRPDGTTCWIDAHGVVVRDGATRMLGVGIDITELKKAEQSVEESEAKYLLLLNSTAEAIYGLDLGGNCTFCNPACLRLLGYRSPGDLLGKNMHDVMHHTRADGTPYPRNAWQIYVAIREKQPSHHTDEVFWRADGTSFPAEYWSYPMSKGAELVGSVVTFLDISERKRAVKALQQSESQYRELFENATYGIFRSSPDGSLLDVNPALVSMLGYDSQEELMTRNLDRDIYETPLARRAAIDTCKLAGRVDGVEVRWKRRDGKPIDVRMSGRMIRAGHGQDGQMEVLVDDITVRRNLEQQLRQAQKMEAVGRLSGGIAHDFNNLLGVIIGYSEILEERLGRDEKLRKPVVEIRKAGQRAASLTRQLLAFSRQQVLEPKVLRLNAVVSDIEKMLRRLIGEDIELTTELAANLGHVKADQGQMEQVIMNLAVNARDAMPSGGKLVIETKNVEVDQEVALQRGYINPGSFVMIAVTDTGMGMDAETQSHIFEPFFTTKEQGKGTGLGLATVYGVVKQSDGFVWVYSEPGHGARFEVLLPRVEEPAHIALKPANSRSSRSGSETILLVEDDDSLRGLATAILSESGYAVLEAANGAGALTLAREKSRGQIHLLLSDVVMPGMSGPQVADEVSSIHPDMKILFMSGYSEFAAGHDQISRPGRFLLQKPFTQQELTSKVREVLDVCEAVPSH